MFSLLCGPDGLPHEARLRSATSVSRSFFLSLPENPAPEAERRFRLAPRLASFLFLTTTALPAWGQERAANSTPVREPQVDEPGTIIIIGIPDFLRDLVPDRTLDSEAVSSYGVDTVEDLINEISAEEGDEEPVILVNGERVESVEDIAFYPAEAVQRLDVLPRSAAARVGAPSGRRVYSLVLHRQVRQATFIVAPRFATAGKWSGARSEAILTRISGPNRLNVALRVRDEDRLLEGERGIIQPMQPTAFDLRGNILASNFIAGTEVDPALSALAGRIVTVAAVPAGATATLANFVAGANAPNITDLGEFRTLRPGSRGYEANLSWANRLAPWLSSTLNARFAYDQNHSLQGLRRGLFILPETNTFSPFSRDVGLAVFGGSDPLDQRNRSIRGNINLALMASLNRWRMNLTGTHNRSDSRYLTDRQDSALIPVLLSLDRNPFAGSLEDLLPVRIDRSVSRTSASSLQATALGPLLELPAGPAQASLEARLGWSDIESHTLSASTPLDRDFSRSERAVRAAIEIPIASRRNDFLADIGELAANLEYGLVDFSSIGGLTQFGYGLVWSPLDWIRFQASINGVRRPPELSQLADPVIVTPGVRTFDFLTGETVDVTRIYGGNPALLPQRARTERLTVSLRPPSSIGLQVTAEYVSTRDRDFVSSLPPASLAILLAFPDRFIRDLNGRLITVDVRPINFARRDERRIRYGLNFNLPIGRVATATSAPAPAEQVGSSPEDGSEADNPTQAPSPPGSRSRMRLQITANHTFVLENEVLIRSGLPIVDLLDGGAIGVGGGRPRHQVDFGLGLSDRGLGARLTGIWRSSSEIETRLAGVPDRLRFAPIGLLNLRAFSEASRFFPHTDWLNGTRLSISVQNLLNDRQRVTDSSGNTPLQYQPAYRDALGRTIEFEIRRVF
jgi:iron complex outermembrane recepter protein